MFTDGEFNFQSVRTESICLSVPTAMFLEGYFSPGDSE